MAPAQGASAAGLAAYLAARKERPAGAVTLYAATAGFHVMPMAGGHGHGPGPGRLAGGALTPVSGVLRAPETGPVSCAWRAGSSCPP